MSETDLLAARSVRTSSPLRRHSFASTVIVVLAAFAFAAFARTYYLKFLFHTPALTLAAQIHGVLATLWIALHFSQARLVATHRVGLHRKLGVFTACVGVTLAAQSLALGILNVAAGRAPPGRDPLQFLSVPVCTSMIFAAFLVGALLMRRRREWHSRLMLLATLGLLVPAAGRLDPFVRSLGVPRGFIAMIVMSALLAWACAHDRARREAIHPVYLWGGAFLLVSVPLRMWLGMQSWWLPMAKWLTGAG